LLCLVVLQRLSFHYPITVALAVWAKHALYTRHISFGATSMWPAVSLMCSVPTAGYKLPQNLATECALQWKYVLLLRDSVQILLGVTE
jgi:hypothetical protein